MKAFQALVNHRASANSVTQRQASASFTSSHAVAQQALHAAINGSAHLKKTAHIQQVTQRAAVAEPLIQRKGNKHLKRFLNVITLGGRKLYVNHKRAAAAGQNQAVQIPNHVDQPNHTEADFLAAYGKSRYYHNTSEDNLKSIDENGLLNYKDRVNMLGNDVVGMSIRAGGEYAGDEKKGVFMGPKKFMLENNLTSHPVRAFLSAERTTIHHWRKEGVSSQELVLDEKFRGGAVITKDSVYSSHVTAKKLEDMLDENDPKLNSILDAIASHYEGPAPDKDIMKGFMRSAIGGRRLSNAAFDNA
ncbi:hypothetical protein CLV58_103122 [Spirosoma oryzae]|uniref:Uncharacterized protein n=1 Tax=Spirosoma oryzae TaxID=1469603 RepID=A0A2T0TER6_9BACT|nr:hypothetical protein [Spirosoma oryzae]PRY44153.1 hypothetical protein CLV58_103122 [Spirosoma oryzae]